MSSSCDKLAISLLSVEEKKEERNEISSSIYDLNEEIKAKKEEYREMLENNEYDDIEELLEEICELESDKKEKEVLLQDYSMGSQYY